MALWWGVCKSVDSGQRSWSNSSKTDPTNNHSRGACQNALKSAAKGIFTSEECQTCGAVKLLQRQRDLAEKPHHHLAIMNETFINNQPTVTQWTSLEIQLQTAAPKIEGKKRLEMISRDTEKGSNKKRNREGEPNCSQEMLTFALV